MSGLTGESTCRHAQASVKKIVSVLGGDLLAAVLLEEMNAYIWSAQVRDSPKLLYVAAWSLFNQSDSKILLRFPFVLGRREAGFDCPDIWHSPIPVWQLPESLLAENLLHKQLVAQASKHCPNSCLALVNSHSWGHLSVRRRRGAVG